MAWEALEIKGLALLCEGGVGAGVFGIFPEFSLFFVAGSTSGKAPYSVFLQSELHGRIFWL